VRLIGWSFAGFQRIKALTVINAFLPEGLEGLRGELKKRDFFSQCQKNNKEGYGMPHLPNLPPFRLRYGGVSAVSSLTTDYNPRTIAPLHNSRFIQHNKK
jgi:hypothetical protein